jgi:hypothetical protein
MLNEVACEKIYEIIPPGPVVHHFPNEFGTGYCFEIAVWA